MISSSPVHEWEELLFLFSAVSALPDICRTWGSFFLSAQRMLFYVSLASEIIYLVLQ